MELEEMKNDVLEYINAHYSSDEIKEFAGHRDDFLDEIKDNMELDSNGGETGIEIPFEAVENAVSKLEEDMGIDLQKEQHSLDDLTR